jgi:hypothetical protein
MSLRAFTVLSSAEMDSMQNLSSVKIARLLTALTFKK